MVGTLILTHGRLAHELLAAAQVIAGELPAFEALSLDWEDGHDVARAKILEALARVDRGEGAIILTDMYGGTPFNVAKQVTEPNRIELVCGVNLPMVLRLGCRTGSGCDQMAVGELATWLEGKGRQSVRRCNPQAPCDGAAPPRGARK